MNRDRRVRVYNAHSWTGISLGIFLFVVCFTGSLALFDHEIQTWEDPPRQLPNVENPVPVQPLMTEMLNDLPEGEITFVGVNYPSEFEPYYTGMVNHRVEGEPIDFIRKRWDPATGAELPDRGDGLSTW